MLRWLFFPVMLFALALAAFSQTAEELVSKNIEAKGGLEKIHAIKTLRRVGKYAGPGGFRAEVSEDSQRPNLVRDNFTIAAMTGVQAYDGSTAWHIQPFGGRKDPELMGDDDARDLLLAADFDGPLVDYKEKGNTVEFLGHDIVDGDDALRLKVTLKNGDIVYYFLDPPTFLEIRRETQEFIRGSIKESASEMGSYKAVAGVMFPFSYSSGPKDDPNSWATTTYDKIEANVPLETSEFSVPASLRKENPADKSKK